MVGINSQLNQLAHDLCLMSDKETQILTCFNANILS